MKMVRDERGVTVALVALMLVILCGIAALVVDVGFLFWERRSMVTAADAAALAGAKELALGHSDAEAIAIAEEYARLNGAEIVGEISVDTVEHNGEAIRAVRANVGRNRELFFARAIGLSDQDVMAGAVATWGHPKAYGKIWPIFFLVPEGFDLPEGEVLLKDAKLSPGNFGYLTVPGTSGLDPIKQVLNGSDDEEHEWPSEGELVTAYTQTGLGQATIDEIEARMDKARTYGEEFMQGVIPILREITVSGHKEVVIAGFAPYKIVDVITAVTKEDDKLWYGRGSAKAWYLENPPVLYSGGQEDKKDAEEEYPKGAIVGEFLKEKFIPASRVSEFTQNPDVDYGLYVVKLIE